MYLDMNEDIMDDNYPLYQKLKDVKFNGKSLTKSELKIFSDYENMSDEELDSKLGSYHNLKFVGRVGLFTPILPGKGGGQLIRESVDKNGNVKYDSVVDTKGYMWLESEDVVKNNKQDDVDMRYYNKLVNEAIETIDQYGDYEWFSSNEPYHDVSIDENGKPMYNIS